MPLIETFLKERGLDHFPAKSGFPPFTRKHLLVFRLSMQGNDIERVRVHRLLSVFLDNRLSWNQHVTVLEERVNWRGISYVALLALYGEGHSIASPFARSSYTAGDYLLLACPTWFDQDLSAPSVPPSCKVP